MPLPGRFVVGQDGTILHAEVNPDYTRRPEPADMLPAIRRASAVAAWLPARRHPPGAAGALEAMAQSGRIEA